MGEGEKGQEGPAEVHYREMVQLAQGAERFISGADLDQNKTHDQFGNNFYRLFVLLGQKKAAKAEKLYGEKWKKFVGENTELLGQIEQAIKGLETYDRLYKLLLWFAYTKRDERWIKRIQDELKPEEIGVAAWNKLNPLLEEASKIMEDYGIDPEEFYS